MAEVVLDRINKSYGHVVAVTDLSLKVRDAEFLVLVGPSGCGKSSVLRLIAGLEAETSGHVYIGGRRVNDVPPKDRDVAMVFQNYALYPHMSVYENLAFGLRLRKKPQAVVDRGVRHAASLLSLEPFLKRKPKELSGGQRQRVALGRAIVREPQVFLMDEPLSNLDAQLRVQTRAELIKLHQRLGTSTIYVTHDQVEAMTMGQRIAVLKDGILQQLDSPQCLYDQPANLFVGQFIGSPSMNVFRGRLVSDGDGKIWADGGGLRLPLPLWQIERAKDRVGQDIIIGLRPEHIRDPRESRGQPTAPVKGVVSVVERLGVEVYVYVAAGGPEFVARLEAAYAPQPGDTVELAVNLDRIYLFDPVTENAIS